MQNFWQLSPGAIILLIAASCVVLVEGYFMHRLGGALNGGVCQQIVREWEKVHTQPITAFSGTSTPVNFKSFHFPQASNFKTQISEAVAKGPNVAGHYVVAEWGCGTACQDHAVVDVQSGEIVAKGLPSEVGLSFSNNSRVIIANPIAATPPPRELLARSLDELITWARLSRDYYGIVEESGATSVKFICTESIFAGMSL